MAADTSSRQITVRFSTGTYERLEQLAQQEQRSVAGLLRVITSAYLNSLEPAGIHDTS
jgi:predicted DNA-binding protein